MRTTSGLTTIMTESPILYAVCTPCAFRSGRVASPRFECPRFR